MAQEIIVTLGMEKVTKNAVKFAEKTESEFSLEKLGSLYVQKCVLPQNYHGQDIEVRLSIAENNCDLTFSVEKPTKTTVKFAEDLVNEFALAKIGSLYIPKTTLAELGWRPDLKQKIAVEISVK